MFLYSERLKNGWLICTPSDPTPWNEGQKVVVFNGPFLWQVATDSSSNRISAAGINLPGIGTLMPIFLQRPQWHVHMFSSWWFQPIWKICWSNWTISAGFRGEHKKSLEPRPRFLSLEFGSVGTMNSVEGGRETDFTVLEAPFVSSWWPLTRWVGIFQSAGK